MHHQQLRHKAMNWHFIRQKENNQCDKSFEIQMYVHCEGFVLKQKEELEKTKVFRIWTMHMLSLMYIKHRWHNKGVNMSFKCLLFNILFTFMSSTSAYIKYAFQCTFFIGRKLNCFLLTIFGYLIWDGSSS